MNDIKSNIFSWCDAQFEEHLALLKTLAAIPAPSHHEEKRVDFIRQWLQENGADTVIVDDAKNVILPLGPLDRPFLVCMAHTDVVFPDTDPLPVREENGRLMPPGVGDDTANVVALMLCARFFLVHPDLLPEPMLLVFNSCEEGLGNLKGVRQIMADYAGRIREFVSFDCTFRSIVSQAVGSHRWKVTVRTTGGHSYQDFGNANAIAHLAQLIGQLYQQEVPVLPGSKTTYNVGLISGGTSVNTIAQSVEMTYEYRSNRQECLAMMEKQFQDLLAAANCPDAEFSVLSLGERPCGGDVPENAHAALLKRCQAAVSAVSGAPVPFCSASTDANIPLSLGIPAATFGLYLGGGAHTREEYLEISSLTLGLKIAMTFFLSPLFKE